MCHYQTQTHCDWNEPYCWSSNTCKQQSVFSVTFVHLQWMVFDVRTMSWVNVFGRLVRLAYSTLCRFKVKRYGVILNSTSNVSKMSQKHLRSFLLNDNDPSMWVKPNKGFVDISRAAFNALTHPKVTVLLRVFCSNVIFLNIIHTKNTVSKSG